MTNNISVQHSLSLLAHLMLVSLSGCNGDDTTGPDGNQDTGQVEVTPTDMDTDQPDDGTTDTHEDAADTTPCTPPMGFGRLEGIPRNLDGTPFCADVGIYRIDQEKPIFLPSSAPCECGPDGTVIVSGGPDACFMVIEAFEPGHTYDLWMESPDGFRSIETYEITGPLPSCAEPTQYEFTMQPN